METIIAACISACVTLIVCLISNRSQQEKTRALMEYKLEELTKNVEMCIRDRPLSVHITGTAIAQRELRIIDVYKRQGQGDAKSSGIYGSLNFPG